MFVEKIVNIYDFIKIDIMKSKADNCLSISSLCGKCYANDFILTKMHAFKKNIKNLKEILFISFRNACKAGSIDCLKSIYNLYIYMNSNYIKDKHG